MNTSDNLELYGFSNSDIAADLGRQIPYTLSFAVTRKKEPFVLSVKRVCITLRHQKKIYATAGLDYSINYYHSGEPV